MEKYTTEEKAAYEKGRRDYQAGKWPLESGYFQKNLHEAWLDGWMSGVDEAEAEATRQKRRRNDGDHVGHSRRCRVRAGSAGKSGRRASGLKPAAGQSPQGVVSRMGYTADVPGKADSRQRMARAGSEAGHMDALILHEVQSPPIDWEYFVDNDGGAARRVVFPFGYRCVELVNNAGSHWFTVRIGNAVRHVHVSRLAQTVERML